MKNFFAFIYISTAFALHSQENIKFIRFTTDEGLPVNYAVAAIQDSKGFMWFGLRGACCRFDGFTFKTYEVPMPDGSIKPKAWINNFVVDSKNRLWAAESGYQGLLLFDYSKDKFTNWYNKINQSGKNFKILSSSLTVDKVGNIYFGTQKQGPFRYNYDTDELKGLTEEYKNADPLLQHWNIFIYIQQNGTIWVYSKNYLAKLTKKDSSCTFYSLDEFNQKGSSSYLHGMYEDSDNTLWLGLSNLSLFRYDEQNNKFAQILNRPERFKDISITGNGRFYEDTHKRLWMTSKNGLWIFNSTKKDISRHIYDEINFESVSSDLITNVYGDRNGNIWLCTSEGISKVKDEKFTSFSYSSRKNSISHNKTQAIAEDKDNNILIATPNGIDIYNTETKKFSVWANIRNNGKGISNFPISIECYKDIGVWVGTFQGGLNYYNYSTQEFTYFVKSETKPDSLSDESVFDILVDSKNRIWIATGSKGVDYYDKENNRFISFHHIDGDENSLCSNLVRKIHEDYNHNIWIGTLGGLSLLEDFENKKFKNFSDASLPLGTKNIMIFDISDTKKGKYLWTGTNTGLIRYDIETGNQRLYNSKDGLISNDAHSILNNKDMIWLSSTNGLYSAKPDYSTDNINIEFRMYSKSDGLQGNEFLSSSCKLEEGSMLFGGPKGFTIFHPDSITDNLIPPQISFTELKIANTTIKVGDTVNGQVILSRPFPETTQITLNHKNNKFSIGFVALHFTHPERNKYKYKLNGYEKKWQFIDASIRRAEYMNLEGGEYVFNIKASNCDGIWNEDGISLHITVLPPWWKTWWFRISIILFLSLIIITYYRYRLSTLQRQKRILEERVFERTQELRQANSQLEEKQEEIMQQNEEIITVNNQLKAKNEEIEAQKEELESSRDQLEKAFNNITLLSEFGQKLTSTFDFDAINKMIYEYVYSLMDTAAFGIGIYNEKRNIIDFPYFMENGKPAPYFFKDLESKKSLSVRCFINAEEIRINDFSVDYKKYLGELPDVQTSELPSSVIHLPLIVENRPIGTVTVNSFKKNAYKDNDVANLRTLASYISIALDNSKAYRIIRSKNEQINGSIRYGQTIQQAMLPPKQQLDKYFENFVLFRPKDIVSGDFYWFASVNNPLNPQGLDSDNTQNPQGFEMGYYFLAVVDCTGHGVPGAFMSMIGSRLLNDIVIERKIYSPSKILEQLNTMIRKALRQDTTDNHDGMDLCLCRFQHKDNDWELTYAGAKRPLLIYNSESDQIEEIQGTRRSIGGVTARKKTINFTEESRIIKSEDVFYLSTDGLVDQCNPQKRKFSQKKLLELLKKIHHLPLTKQKEIAENELDAFQAGFEQRDDITLVGIKLLG